MPNSYSGRIFPPTTPPLEYYARVRIINTLIRTGGFPTYLFVLALSHEYQARFPESDQEIHSLSSIRHPDDNSELIPNLHVYFLLCLGIALRAGRFFASVVIQVTTFL